MIQILWWWLLLLLPLPLVVRHFMERAANREAALQVPFFREMAGIENTSPSLATANIGVTLIAVVAWCLLVLAASRPQWVGEPVDLPTTGRDLMLAVDISGSMEAQDIMLRNQAATRLAVVKDVVGDFVARRSGDRLGLILFAARAYTQAPLTFDRETVETLLYEARIGIIEENATSIGDAIGLGVRHLRDRPQASRVLILLTDGVNNAGEVEPMQAGDLAAREGIRVYTIGIGADPTITSSPFGPRSINPSADLDEVTLTAIAEGTGGRYFRARDRNELEDIYGILDELEPVEQDAETFRPVIALYYWPLAGALLLSFLIALIRVPWSALSRSGTQQPEAEA